MWFRLAACAAVLLVPCACARAAVPSASSASVLTLEQAFERVADAHPDLKLFGALHAQRAAERDIASQRPAWTAGVELENALGTGAVRGLDGAELTLSLASVFERGGKLDARRAVAQSRLDALSIEREARRLDLLAETARRYLALVAAQRQQAVSAIDVEQRMRTVAAARRRLEAGASPASVLFTAQAALARAELERARAVQDESASRQHLAALWGERAPAFAAADQDPTSLPHIDDVDAIAARLERTPELRQFASEQRIREARLQLARSDSVADMQWSIGVRRMQEGGDVGLVAALSMPLGARARAQPSLRAAESDLAALALEREAQGMALYSTLIQAHGRYRLAQLQVSRLADDILPKLASAESAAERAYRAGAISYLEWAQIQSERIAALRQQLDAALEGQRALIELQRLTGASLLSRAPAPTPESLP